MYDFRTRPWALEYLRGYQAICTDSNLGRSMDAEDGGSVYGTKSSGAG